MSITAPNPETITTVIDLLRRDLRIDTDISAETPLLGGDYDIDSLDILMLLTSIERQFGFKIPNDAIREDAFRNPTSLAAFVEEIQATAGT